MDSPSPQTSPASSYLLSPLQHAMLLHSLQAAEPGVDVEQLVGRLHEPIDAEGFARAWGEIASCHEVLRTRFRWRGQADPEQEVSTSVATPFDSYDWRDLAPAEQESRLAAFLVSDRRRGFDLGVSPLWRVTLFRLAESEQCVVWTYSHAILDGCYAEVLREVFAAYEAARQGRKPELVERLPYRDHVVWLARHLKETAEQAKVFWRSLLAGFVAPTNLEAVQRPSSAARPIPASGHDTLRFELSREISNALRATCARHDLRVSVLVEAAWSIVLAAFSGEDDVVFGSTRACRRSSLPGAESTIGLFINTVPVRVRINPDQPILAWLRELRSAQIALRAFEQTPLVDIVACAESAPGAPLFETIIVYNERDNDARLKSFGDAWKFRDFELHDQTSFPFNVMVYGEPELAFKLSYERARFDRGAVERIAELLMAAIHFLARRPEGFVRDLPRLPDGDATRIFGSFNDTQRELRGPPCVHEAFEAQADRTPDADALVFRDDRITYRELDERANRVAHELLALGVGADVTVGVFVERSIEMVCGLLGILKAGGAYVPLDPTYPRERIAGMVADAKLGVVLTLDHLKVSLPDGGAKVIALDRMGDAGDARRPRRRAGADDLAYVMFTSGSTGRPKGVQIEHRNVTSFFEAMDQLLGTTPGVWLAVTSISFDISVLELFWTLSRGFTVVLQEGTPAASPRTPQVVSASMGFSLFYFAADAEEEGRGKYRLLLEGAKFADDHGFEAVWTPERHFHAFGGLYPNPSLTGAAIAATTRRVAIRAGSIVLPLHNPIRCAEEWAVVDNLSGGRVGLSFASGWHANDFALAPGHFRDRRERLFRDIETVRALWRGEAVKATSGDGQEIEVRIYPRPVQREPALWITASGSPETFAAAGRMGASVLTNLLVMRPEELVANVATYRKAFREGGHAGDGHVTLMLHTFVGEDLDHVRKTVRRPFLEYLRTSTDLINKARWERTAFGLPANKGDDRRPEGSGPTPDLAELSPEDMDAILDHAFERYFTSAGLFGTPETCLVTVERLREMGVDEVACLIDFGVDTDTVLASLPHLDALRRRCRDRAATKGDGQGIAALIRRHGVTHMQCTPSLLSMIEVDEDSLASLESLKMLLVGGEALPAPLVERLRPRLRGVLRNMYGPTETTIWSTCSAVESAEGITIGGPIANTRVYVVDRALRPCPIGVPGEILIGGAGVARGYLGQPELTAERFVPDRFGAGRLYRTGDVARWTAAGELEYLGRVDNQVKLRGHRIELGEIEAVLGSHPAVRESVVVAKKGASEGARLVAYVVLRDGSQGSLAPAPQGSANAWRTIWDETYRGASDDDAALNTAGWRSSYDGEAISQAEMREWADAAASRVLALAGERGLRPRVLEIGCGTGMLLFRVAPRCSRYVGIDFSESALSLVSAEASARGLDHVRFERLQADDLRALEGESAFDIVVLNSVIQYFPDAAYLERVLTEAYRRLSPGGTLFLGDIRSLPHLRAFHESVEVATAPDDMPLDEWRARVSRRVAAEGELVVDPRYFEALASHWPDVEGVREELKPGRARNEMTRFRYDIAIRKMRASAPPPPPAPIPAVPAPVPCSIESLRGLLREHPGGVRVLGVPNARLTPLVRAPQWLASNGAGALVGELRAAMASGPHEDDGALDPEDIRAESRGYDPQIRYSRDHIDAMDVVFRPRSEPLLLDPVDARAGVPSSSLASYANHPAVPASSAAWSPILRDALRQRLPEPMVPGAIVVLDSLPRTANGKVDRARLPAPLVAPKPAVARSAAPRGETERIIATVFEELLGASDIGVDDNFFDLGANSLMMVQASVRLRASLRRSVSLVQLFQYPTVRALGAALTGEGPEVPVAAHGQERAQVRQDAMQRRRELRNAGRGTRWQ